MADSLSPGWAVQNFISHCNIKCTSVALRFAGAAGDWMLYQAYQAHSDIMVPVRALAGMAAKTVGERLNGSARPSPLSNLTAAYELIARAGLTHARPPYGIDSVMVGNREVAVTEEAADVTPFGTLLHFKKDIEQAQPRVLLIAPLSGHFATLLRATVRTMLPEHDVYITDWHNARDVADRARPLRLRRIYRPPDPLPGDDRAGRASGGGVPALRGRAGGGGRDGAGRQSGAAALDDADGRPDRHPRQPDQGQRARQGQTDRLVREEPDRITCPSATAAADGAVYPGFVQLAAFMSMNIERHLKAHQELYENLAKGEQAKAAATKAFYDEYFAVLDLTAEFYLETVRLVFQEHALPLGALTYENRTVEPAAIKRTMLFTVEGEKDDICAVGQTLAAHDLCTSLRPYRKRHHMQAGVGHYGVFSGRTWQNQIYPMVKNVILQSD